LTILTIRSPQEGGKEVPNRKELFERACPHSDYTDIELSSQDLLPFVRDLVKGSGEKLIISYHNFGLTPANWILRGDRKLFEKEGFEVIALPLIQDVPLDFDMPEGPFDFVLFQSQKAVKRFFAKCSLAGKEKILAVGEKTKAEEAKGQKPFKGQKSCMHWQNYQRGVGKDLWHPL
jgi:hypothetical protein